MQVKIPILAALVVLTTVLAIPLATHPAAAISGPPVTDPSNIWYPYGPNVNTVNKIQFQYYSTETVEFTNFELGKIDLTDWELPPAKYASFDSNPDFLLTPSQGQFGDYGFYFNGASSRFSTNPENDNGANGPFWTCNWNAGTPFTSGYNTYTSACGINMRQAFTHLIDRPTFTANRGGLAPLQCPSPPAKDPSCVSVPQQCAWDSMFPTCIDAYRIAPNPTGFAATGSPDFCAAADHMIAAGIATGKTAGSCVLTGVVAGVFAHPLRFMIRNNDPRRLAFGNGLMDAVNRLMGGTAVTPTYGNINQIGFPIVFSDPPDGALDDWDGYTYGFSLGSPYPDHLYGTYNRIGASNLCGGPQSGSPNDAQFVCIPALDSATLAAAQSPDASTFKANTLNAYTVWGANAVDIPVFAPAIRIPALRSAGGLVNAKGFGYNNAFSVDFGHQGTYSPLNSLYQFGNGDPHTLRYGQASGTQELNIFKAQTVWEFQLLVQIYDTLLTASPVQPGNILCEMCVTYGPKPTIDTSGNSHFLVELRQDLRWQDGVPVTASDVKFSWLNFRDSAPTTVGGSYPGLLKDIVVLDNTHLDIQWFGQSISYPVFMENFIIPQHLWDSGDNFYGQGVGHVDPAKAVNTFDPLTSGILVGSGPFACISVFASDSGKVGTGCASNSDGSRAGQNLGPGATALLQAFDFVKQPGAADPFLQFQRTYDNTWGTGTGVAAESGLLQEFKYADSNKDAQITVSDLASVASCFGASAPTTACPAAQYNYWLQNGFHPSSTGTISSEVTVVAAHLDDTYVAPFAWDPTSLQNIIPYSTP
jgi:hypothetical protein